MSKYTNTDRKIQDATDLLPGDFVLVYWGVRPGIGLVRITDETDNHNTSSAIKQGVYVGGTDKELYFGKKEVIAGKSITLADGLFGWGLASKANVMGYLNQKASLIAAFPADGKVKRVKIGPTTITYQVNDQSSNDGVFKKHRQPGYADQISVVAPG